jgi:hypothetical protein
LRNWGIHSAWIIGILLALLIGMASVHWNAIKDLPGIISFAVGLSSLVLAVIAIFQTLSSTNSVEGALSAVRQAAEGVGQVASELAANAGKITRAADDAQKASSSALQATAEYASVSGTLIASTEAGRQAISELREDMKVKQSTETTHVHARANPDDEPIGTVPMGANATLLVLTMAYRTGKSFKLKNIFVDDNNLSYETGYIAALETAGLVETGLDEGVFTVKKLSSRILEAESFAERKYITEFTQELNAKRISQVQKYFAME